ncbi:predicted protein [Botrytis cinerea T4]|uniref:Uncharacterized protein n=1 Tax=Botryotinia fuckeliana (strain T4) TaxID=999810 RepID=G2Y9H3_BOTF4|nr:predicted protein [Botrytis cinerea T4]
MADSSNWRVRAPANTSSEARPTNWSSRKPRDDHRQRQTYHASSRMKPGRGCESPQTRTTK